jgi:preprotein translocase subunit SecG
MLIFILIHFIMQQESNGGVGGGGSKGSKEIVDEVRCSGKARVSKLVLDRFPSLD